MRNIFLLLCVCSLFFVGLGSLHTHAQTQTADQLWVDYQDANQNASAASNNYNIQVDAANDINKQIEDKEKTMDDATAATLETLFKVGVGLYAGSVPTLFVAGIGQVTPTLDIVKGWLDDGNLDALKVLADQATSDAHMEAAKYATAKTNAYDDYLAQFRVENPGYGDEGYTGPAPKGTLLDTNHKVYVFACLGGCGVSWDRIDKAERTHLASGVCSGTPSGCGQPYYTCDSQHQPVFCRNFQCVVSFRPCSNSRCNPSGSLWSSPVLHSASGTSGEVPASNVEYYCPQCNAVHGG